MALKSSFALQDELNERSERYIRKCDKYRRVLEQTRSELGDCLDELERARAELRENLGSTLTNSSLFEAYVKQGEKQTADLLEKLGEVKARNATIREQINKLRLGNNNWIQELGRLRTAVLEAEHEKQEQRDLAKAYNSTREEIEREIENLKRTEREAQNEFKTSFEVARQIHKRKAAEEGRKLSELRKNRKRTHQRADRMPSGPQGRSPETRKQDSVRKNASVVCVVVLPEHLRHSNYLYHECA